MDIIALVVRKQNEADALAQTIASLQADLDAKLLVVDHLHELQIQSLYTPEDVTYLFEQSK